MEKIYSGKPDLLTRAFAKNLLTYATGAKPRFSDQTNLDTIVAKSSVKGYKLRSIVHATLASETFKTK